MKKTLTVALFLACLTSYSQITSDQIKTSLVGKEWLIVNYEMFGVATAPEEAQLKDKVRLNSDMSFTIVENGIEIKGKWTIMNPAEYISCKSTTGAWTKVYRVLSIGETESIIQFKDPDLIKTNYILNLVKE